TLGSAILALSTNGGASAPAPVDIIGTASAATIATTPAPRASSCLLAVLPVEPRRVLPVNDLHEGIDISHGFCAIIHVVGMFVHVERQDRPAAGEVGFVVGGPAIDEALVARRVGKDDPARAAAFGLAHRRELGLPAFEAAEIAHDRLG